MRKFTQLWQHYGFLRGGFEKNVYTFVSTATPVKDTGYDLRQRSHHRTLPSIDIWQYIRNNFGTWRMLFTDVY